MVSLPSSNSTGKNTTIAIKENINPQIVPAYNPLAKADSNFAPHITICFSLCCLKVFQI